jgi:hypothetical protein
MIRRILWFLIFMMALAATYILYARPDWVVIPPTHQYAPDTCIEGQGPDHVCTHTQPPEPTPAPQPTIEPYSTHVDNGLGMVGK